MKPKVGGASRRYQRAKRQSMDGAKATKLANMKKLSVFAYKEKGTCGSLTMFTSNRKSTSNVSLIILCNNYHQGN